jgi:hypothetical protein
MQTDANGVAVVEVDPGQYTVTVTKAGYKTARADSPVVQSDQEVTMPFQLQPNKGRIRVVVTDSKTGAPISGVEVTVSPKV